MAATAELAERSAASLDQIRKSQSELRALAQVYPELDSAVLAVESGAICADHWALRHRLVNLDSGLSVPMRCDRYTCLACGPRKVSMWRDLVALAKPERFITLSRIGGTLAEVARALTVIVRRLRRAHFAFEYLATFELHKRAENGYHVHMLQRGDFIPQGALSEALRSATHGRSWVCDIRRASGDVAGYVTKYVTKQLGADEVGKRPDGTRAKPRRIRYSRHFFPTPTEVLRGYVRAVRQDAAADAGAELVDVEGSWVLHEVAELPRDFFGRVDQEAAQAQYRELLMARADEVGTEVHHSRGGLMVLSWMLAQQGQAVGEV